ncbi:MAG: hypothetical protein NVS3B6_13790 [Pseudarthrobacter sp.]
MVVEHARRTVDLLLKCSPVISLTVQDSSTAVISVVYRLEGGRAQLVTDPGLL